jgi:tetratricopeptide (TPR) repeat protein
VEKVSRMRFLRKTKRIHKLLCGLALSGLLSIGLCMPVFADNSSSLERLKQAQMAIEDQRIDEAFSIYEKIVADEPSNRVALFQLGWISNERQQFEKALGYFKKVEPDKNDGQKIMCEMGYAYRRLSRFDEAIAAYRKATEFRSDYLPAWQGLGELLFVHSKNYPAAEKAYQRLVELNPNSALACYRLGWCLNDSGHPDKAITLLQQATRVEPKYKAAWVELAFCEMKLSRFKEAHASSLKALSLDESSILARDYAARACHRLGKKDEAQTHYQKLLKLSPERAAKLKKFFQSKS